METICKTAAQAAKNIRIELKAAFPGIKFSVRSRTFSMGDSVDISWTNGPTDKAVSAITGKYQYDRFDSMTDSSSTEDTLISLPGGEIAVLGGAKFVHTHRNFSDDVRDLAMRDICRLYCVEFDGERTGVMQNSIDWYWSVGYVANRVLGQADLSNGLAGIIADSEANHHLRVVSEGESSPVKDAPEAVPEIAPAASLTYENVLAARAILQRLGHSAYTMRAEALRDAVYHIAYIRYPQIDRSEVLTDVLNTMMVEVAE